MPSLTKDKIYRFMKLNPKQDKPNVIQAKAPQNQTFGNENLFNGFGVSILQDENVLEIDYSIMSIYLTH